MDEDVGRVEVGPRQLDEPQTGSPETNVVTELTAATSAQSLSCSHYEPHYQQMHPSLIYYDEQAAYLHHHHLHHHHSHLTNHNQGMAAAAAAAAAAVVSAASGNSLTNQHQQWEHHQDHFVPIMIPFGHTSSPNCFSATGPHTELQDQTLDRENEPVVVSPSFRAKAASTESIKTPERTEKDECKTTEIVQSKELTTNESFGGENSSTTPTNRELHNEIERRRRSRIKHCCEVLRTLVPGLTEKTDKATVLEHTVNFVAHLVRDCKASKCNCVVNVDE